MRIVATVESRMTSKRLPGKHLKPILGKPMLSRLLERLKMSQGIDTICLATSTDPSDDALNDLAKRENVPCYRGSLEDVLERVLRAAKSVGADTIVEITGDCPLVDPRMIDKVIARYDRGDYDYISTILDKVSFPDGFDIQVFSVNLLEKVSRLASDQYDRNNVTPFIYHNPERYRLLNLYAPPWLDRPSYRMCVDYQEDLDVVSAIFEHLYPKGPAFGVAEIIRFLDGRADLVAHNNSKAKGGTFPTSGGAATQELLAFDE